MSSSSSLSLKASSNDPIYGSVYKLLQNDYIGSWADAGYAYSQTRRDLVWTGIKALLSAKPTKGNQEKMAPLLQELQRISADLSDTAASSPTSFLAAQALVTVWATPAPVKASANGPRNAFAALSGDSDEE